MAAQPTRRSPRILALSTIANRQPASPSHAKASAKRCKSSSTRSSKRKAPIRDSDVPNTKDVPRPSKRRRLDASIYTVRSEPDPQYLAPSAIAKARKQYFAGDFNPFHILPIWGTNPYNAIWKEYKFPDPTIHTLPPMDPPPPLKRLSIRYSELTSVEVIRNWDGHEGSENDTSIFRTSYKGKVYILKLFRSWAPLGGAEWGPHKFAREKRAYEYLLHGGVCAEGFVPMCYGWFQLRVPKKSGWLRSVASDETPPYALLIEYIPDAVPLSVSNISVSAAEQLHLAAEFVHGAGVLHNDIYPRNTLLRPDGTVVIIDFDRASTLPRADVNRLSLKFEMQHCWCMCYSRMIN
ncbi:hypothetical protein NEOLEDRAFT_380826 [Neolentinus lepideus HHB14362 ss-1]|uniref:Protein kinase domain-containing protein n=1 Tax=Neolentinus lepideus HHB14362 ss-1 TaxID=1314782 RepID=A0A165SCL3_9AGAM|nr:hypothetical protein NEOLEDRAFT_380826 [Neolentinus lepideus HHB14362 ss-1]